MTQSAFDKEGNEISLIDVLTADNEIIDSAEVKLQEEKMRKTIDIPFPEGKTGYRDALWAF